jgi:RNA polymerase sigma-70 factor (ECF subfamily)
MTPAPEDPQLVAAQQERSALLGLCYRMLGTMADAEDAVQETYARWFRLSESERDGVEAPRAWLMKAASRICLDMLTSARARREQYVGPWLPEPVPGTGGWSSGSVPDDPADRVTLDDSVSMAVLVLLETMTPAERVAFVLHDVFRYTFTEISEIVGRTPAACRQLASSARRHVREQRRTAATSGEHAAAVAAFQKAWQTGDVTALMAVLDPDAQAIADGGGQVTAAVRPVVGADRIAKFMFGFRDQEAEIDLQESIVNSLPGLVVVQGGATVAVISFQVVDGRIERIWATRNPNKLTEWPTSEE